MWRPCVLSFCMPLAFSMAATPGPAFADTVVRAEWISGDCPKGLPPVAQEAPQKFSGLLIALASVILPKLVSGGVDLAAKSLQAAGEDRLSTLAARTSHESPRIWWRL